MKRNKILAGVIGLVAAAGLMVAPSVNADIAVDLTGAGFYEAGGTDAGFAGGTATYQQDSWLFQVIWIPSAGLDVGTVGPGGTLGPSQVLLHSEVFGPVGNGYYGYVGSGPLLPSNEVYRNADYSNLPLETGLVFTRSFNTAAAAFGDQYFQSAALGGLTAQAPAPAPPVKDLLTVSAGLTNVDGGPAMMTGFVVPEPGVFALVLVGLGTIAYRRRK